MEIQVESSSGVVTSAVQTVMQPACQCCSNGRQRPRLVTIAGTERDRDVDDRGDSKPAR